MTERRRTRVEGFQNNPCKVVYTIGELGTVRQDMTQSQLSTLLKNPEVMLISVNDQGIKRRNYPVKRKLS